MKCIERNVRTEWIKRGVSILLPVICSGLCLPVKVFVDWTHSQSSDEILLLEGFELVIHWLVAQCHAFTDAFEATLVA